MEKFDKKTRFIGIALFFLAIGMMTSSTLVSGFHIICLIPTILLYLDRSNKIHVSKSSWILLLLLVWAIISGFYNLDQMQDIRKSFDDLKFYLLGFAFILPLRYFYERTTGHQRKKLLNIFFFVLIVSFVVAALKSWFNFNLFKFRFEEFGPDRGRSGGFVDIMRYGYSNALLFVLFLMAFINREKIREYITPKLFYPAFACSFFAIFAAQTRGALLGLFASIPFVFFRYQPKLAKKVLAVGIIAFIAMVGVSFSLGEKNPIRIINLNNESTNIRLSQYISGLYAIKENPIFGLGPTQFSYHVTDIKERHDIWAKDFVGHSHNTFIEHGANFGVPGFILFILFLAFWFREMIGLRSDFGWAIASYIVGYTVSGQFELLFDSVNSHLMFFLYSFSQIFVQYKERR